MPLGRILVRHLPMDLFGPSLADAAASAAAAQNYVSAGPLMPRTQSPDNPQEQP